MSTSFTVTLSERTTARLRADAEQQGVSIAVYLVRLLTDEARERDERDAAAGISRQRNADPPATTPSRFPRDARATHTDALDAALAWAAAQRPTRTLTARIMGDPDKRR